MESFLFVLSIEIKEIYVGKTGIALRILFNNIQKEVKSQHPDEHASHICYEAMCRMFTPMRDRMPLVLVELQSDLSSFRVMHEVGMVHGVGDVYFSGNKFYLGYGEYRNKQRGVSIHRVYILRIINESDLELLLNHIDKVMRRNPPAHMITRRGVVVFRLQKVANEILDTREGYLVVEAATPELAVEMLPEKLSVTQQDIKTVEFWRDCAWHEISLIANWGLSAGTQIEKIHPDVGLRSYGSRFARS